MTPKQNAADRIARAIAPSLCVCVAAGLGPLDSGDCMGCIHDAARFARCAVEDISAAGVVMVQMEGLRAIAEPGQRRPVVADGSTHATAIEWARDMIAAAQEPRDG